MKLHIVRADPAGNITLFVLDPVAQSERAAFASELMERPELDIEQVAFVCSPRCGGDGRIEMMGGEFCGNAARAMGLLLAKERGITGQARLWVEVGGSEAPVAVDVDTQAGTACAAMPLPRSEKQLCICGAAGLLVDLGGIVHFVTRHAPDKSLLDAAELWAALPAGVEAFGVIFLHNGHMTPLVKVCATNTEVWEGSCGSGSLAAAVMESRDRPEGHFARDYIQPAGTIRAELIRRNGCVTEARIGGMVTLDAPAVVELQELESSI